MSIQKTSLGSPQVLDGGWGQRQWVKVQPWQLISEPVKISVMAMNWTSFEHCRGSGY